MNTRWKKHPVFTGVLAVLLLGLVAESGCLWGRYTAARTARRLAREREEQFQQLAGTMPPPTDENAALIEQDLARTQTALTAMQAELRGRGPAAGRLRTARRPERRTDAFFDIASFGERLRDRARRAGVALTEGERFGFSLYAHTGPEPGLIPAVYQQRLIAQYLGEALIDARPRRIISFSRERPRPSPLRTTRAQTELRGTVPGEGMNSAAPGVDVPGPDVFALEPRLSARVPGFVDTQAFRATFVGPTAALRAFLNKLAGFELPLVVRQVEVSPFAEGEADSAAAAASPAEAAPVPLVARSLSQFTVTVEFIELVAPSAVDSAGVPPAGSAAMSMTATP